MSTSEDYGKMSDSAKKKEDWMNTKWRPAMGWMYMLVCVTDFVLFPVLWSIIQVHGGGEVKAQWQPITLQGAGLFHIAMGAILGIAAYGRTQEKLGGANNGGLSLPTPTPAPSFGTPAAPAPVSTGVFSAPATSMPVSGGFGGSGFGSSTQSIATTASGKKIVPQDPDPVI
jgi:hypothetical protein